MHYQEILPYASLLPYLDCYWSIRTEDKAADTSNRVVPDICADIIINVGEDVQVSNNKNYLLRHGEIYLTGTMTTFQDTILTSNTHLIGIRFKPFGMSSLLNIFLQGAADTIAEAEKSVFNLSALSTRQSQVSIDSLNKYLASRIRNQNVDRYNHIIGTILDYNGNIPIHKLAHDHCISERQFERLFQSHLGVTAKEICNIVRFQHAFKQIKNRKHESLLDIAYTSGYYDHGHLTRHIKKYSGQPPSCL
ncbi:helix-turn-helix domain-containing protein [Cytophagaceae bacterium YF14B1]|uniref:Helix-turn-helix domain-containing protein n=1 Tax=Xanthocytophaga flava TaxID=3048013 RepID=A0AAE3QZC3_9BACT|nr:helix-turn-helix domain-containing protein [Xanthocytophaga flavus]MDJ1485514.1 helix-turn-helix domain-containing protein [Xanthocytophaga flavus]